MNLNGRPVEPIRVFKDLDSLVIGIDNKDIWLIDVFDLTSKEMAFSKFYKNNKLAIKSDKFIKSIDSTIENIFKMIDIK